MGKFDNLKLVGVPVGHVLSICLKCNTEEDAKKVLEQCVEQSDSLEIAVENLGYIFGYAGEEERKRLYSLFHLQHPIFGEGFGKGDDSKFTGALGVVIGNVVKMKNEKMQKKDC